MDNSKIQTLERKRVGRDYESVLGGFETREEAEKWIADYRAFNFVYFPRGFVKEIDGKILVHLTEADSCD